MEVFWTGLVGNEAVGARDWMYKAVWKSVDAVEGGNCNPGGRASKAYALVLWGEAIYQTQRAFRECTRRCQASTARHLSMQTVS